MVDPCGQPKTSLNALEYCPRKFYYQFVQGETLVNEFVLEGTLAHQRVHQAGTHTTAEGEIETTRLYLSNSARRHCAWKNDSRANHSFLMATSSMLAHDDEPR